MIQQSTIQQILSRIDILEIVGSYVKLKKRGANYLGLCPFHNEKTPSFTVSPAKEIFKCFGCGKSGNSISFLMEHDKLSYAEALRALAARYNIEVEETARTPEQLAQVQAGESLQIINAFAQKFYEDRLWGSEDGQASGGTYLRERGFSEAIIRQFGLGYAPESRDAFTREALVRQFNPELLKKAGLVAERGEALVDSYRDRIIFPIHNPTGKVIGFGARLLKANDRAPKYINTPENELYVKSRILYGTYFARHAIDKADECLLVEGYTDVISLHAAGIQNVVASGGTALTTDQLRLIKKYTKNLTILYDGDAAGIKAAVRGLDLALEERLQVRLALLPNGEDPDSYVRKFGAAAFRQFIEEEKKDFIFFLIEVGMRDAGGDTQKKSEVVNSIAETIAKIDKTEDFTRQQDYIRLSAQRMGIDEGGFTALVNKFIRNRISIVEEKLPFAEAKVLEENAKKGEASGFDDQTFSLLYRDELQEREVVRILLEHGTKKVPEGEGTIAAHIFSELPGDDLLDNLTVARVLQEYREHMERQQPVDKQMFLYHPEQEVSTLAVSLLHFPHEESPRWKQALSNSTGYQKSLFQQDYKSFMQAIAPGHEENLMSHLNMQRDTTMDEVESALNYIKLRKVRRLLLQNQEDLQEADPSRQAVLFRTHQHLKEMEMDLSKKVGLVILR